MGDTDNYQPKVYFNGVGIMNWHAYDDVVDDDDIENYHVGDANNDEDGDDHDDDNNEDEDGEDFPQWKLGS